MISCSVEIRRTWPEFDPAYRQKLREERLKSDRSFGASLRRLRLQRQLKRGDFPGIADSVAVRIQAKRGDAVELLRPGRRLVEAGSGWLKTKIDLSGGKTLAVYEECP